MVTPKQRSSKTSTVSLGYVDRDRDACVCLKRNGIKFYKLVFEA
jgi:hypothetical protein